MSQSPTIQNRLVSGSRRQGIRALQPPQAKVLSNGYSQAYIARVTGLKEITVSRALRGVVGTAQTQRKIAAAVGMTPRALFGRFLHRDFRGGGQ